MGSKDWALKSKYSRKEGEFRVKEHTLNWESSGRRLLKSNVRIKRPFWLNGVEDSTDTQQKKKLRNSNHYNKFDQVYQGYRYSG